MTLPALARIGVPPGHGRRVIWSGGVFGIESIRSSVQDTLDRHSGYGLRRLGALWARPGASPVGEGSAAGRA